MFNKKSIIHSFEWYDSVDNIDIIFGHTLSYRVNSLPVKQAFFNTQVVPTQPFFMDHFWEKFSLIFTRSS